MKSRLVFTNAVGSTWTYNRLLGHLSRRKPKGETRNQVDEMPTIRPCDLALVSANDSAIMRQMKRNSGNFGPIPSARPASDQDAKRARRERCRQTKRLKGE